MLSKRFFSISVYLVSVKSVVIFSLLLIHFFSIGCFHSKQIQPKINVVDIVPLDKPVPDELLHEYADELYYRALKQQDAMENPSEEIQKQIAELKKIRKMLADAKRLQTDAKFLLEGHRKVYGYANPVE